MFTKIKHQYSRVKIFALQLKDVRTIGWLFFLAIVLMTTWSGVKAINTNYALQRQIFALQQENEIHGLANENLRLTNEYFQTDQYLDLAARESFGLASPGETVLIVPKKVALKYTIELSHEPQPTARAEDNRPTYQRNFQAWMDFFLHRQTDE